MIKVQSKEKYETSIGTVIMVENNQRIIVGDYISDEKNEKYEVTGIQMPTHPSSVGVIGLIVKSIV